MHQTYKLLLSIFDINLHVLESLMVAESYIVSVFMIKKRDIFGEI